MSTVATGRGTTGAVNRDGSWTTVVAKLGRLVERRMQVVLAEQEISAGQFMALSHLASHPGINRAELARALQVTPQAVSGLVGQLADRGLLDRTASRPGHSLELRLTLAGEETVRQAEALVDALSRQLLAQCVRPDAVASMDGAFRHVLTRLTPANGPGSNGPAANGPGA
jgi:DNA-binding MarR family transcriptional regulator